MGPSKEGKQTKELFSDCLNMVLEQESKPEKLLNVMPA